MQARAIRCDNRRDLFADQRHGTIMDIRRIAIVGAGVIGASWAAFYLTQGFDVVATDPAPQADTRLRDALAAFRRPGRRTFRAAVVRRRSRACARRRRLRAGERPGAARPEARAVPADGRRAARARADRVEAVGPEDVGHPDRVRQASGALPDRASVQSAAPDSTRRAGRRRCHQPGRDRAREGFLRCARQADDRPQQGNDRPRREPARGRAVPRGVSPRRRRRGERGRCGQGRRMGPACAGG